MTDKGLCAELKQTLADFSRWSDKIDEALAHGGRTHSLDDVLTLIMTGKVHFYAYEHCAVLMQLSIFPNMKAYHCFIACGDMQAIIDAQEKLIPVAKNLGASVLSIAGRPGWARALKDDGWMHKLSTLHKDISDVE